MSLLHLIVLNLQNSVRKLICPNEPQSCNVVCPLLTAGMKVMVTATDFYQKYPSQVVVTAILQENGFCE